MLANIKSVYFIKLVFSKIDEKRKLNIVKYNKSLQNILSIKLINYIFISNKYIVYEENGIGKEYDCSNDELLYIGQYKNGERNGKIKKFDYHNGKLIFEGEYLNGKKWNGKGYNDNGNIVYKIENGKGYIKEYNKEGKFIIEGEYLNGERNGKGKEFYYNGKLMFEGEYLNGKRFNGKGKEYDIFGKLIFDGEYLYGIKFPNKDN